MVNAHKEGRSWQFATAVAAAILSQISWNRLSVRACPATTTNFSDEGNRIKIIAAPVIVVLRCHQICNMHGCG